MSALLDLLGESVSSLTGVFVLLLNMGLSATLVTLAVILARLLFKRAPKSFSYALWLAVGLRLALPASFRLPFSLLGLTKPRLEQATGLPEYIPYELSGGGTTTKPILPPVPGVEIHVPAAPAQSIDPIQVLTAVFCAVWLLGILCLVVYSAVSYWKTLRRVREAVLKTGPEVDDALARLRLTRRIRVYESDRIASPFVCGFLRPRVYLNAGLSGTELTYILTHELVHIKRFDYLVKPFAFLLLLAHWYNPVLWAAFALMGKDQEMSCDERVVKLLGGSIRADYSESLLTIAAGGRPSLSFGLPLGTPLAFGESGIKGRIKNILSYKKPTVWVAAAALAAVVVLLVFFLADPLHTNASRDTSTDAEALQRLVGSLELAPDPMNLRMVYEQRILPLETSGLLDEPFDTSGAGGASLERISPDGMVRYAANLNVLSPGEDGALNGEQVEAVCTARFPVDAALVRESSFYDAERKTYAQPGDAKAIPAVRSVAGPSWNEVGPAYYLACFRSEEDQKNGVPFELYQVILDDSANACLAVRNSYPPKDWETVTGWSTNRDGTPVWAEVLELNGTLPGGTSPVPEEAFEDAESFYRQFIEPLYESGILELGFDNTSGAEPSADGQIPADSLLHFYALTTGWSDTSAGISATLDASTVEDALRARFYTSVEWLRTSTQYDASSSSYKIPVGQYNGSSQYALYEVRGPGEGQLEKTYAVAYFSSEEEREADEPAEIYQITLENVGIYSHWPHYLSAGKMNTELWQQLKPRSDAALSDRIKQLEEELAKVKADGASSGQGVGSRYQKEIESIQAEINRIIASNSGRSSLTFRGEAVSSIYSLDFLNRAYHPVTDAAAMGKAAGLLSTAEAQTVEAQDIVGFLIFTDKGKYEFNYSASENSDIVRLAKECNAATAGVAQWLAYMSEENITRITFTGSTSGSFRQGGAETDMELDTTDRNSIAKLCNQLKRIPVEPSPVISTLEINPATNDMTMISLGIYFRSDISYWLWGTGADAPWVQESGFSLRSSDRESHINYNCSPAQIDALRNVVESLPETIKKPW